MRLLLKHCLSLSSHLGDLLGLQVISISVCYEYPVNTIRERTDINLPNVGACKYLLSVHAGYCNIYRYRCINMNNIIRRIWIELNSFRYLHTLHPNSTIVVWL